jgi:hypothetical protein
LAYDLRTGTEKWRAPPAKKELASFGKRNYWPLAAQGGALYGFDGTPHVVGDQVVVTTDTSMEAYDLHAEGSNDSRSGKRYTGWPEKKTEPVLIASGDMNFLIFATGLVVSGYGL